MTITFEVTRRTNDAIITLVIPLIKSFYHNEPASFVCVLSPAFDKSKLGLSVSISTLKQQKWFSISMPFAEFSFFFGQS